MQDHMCLTLMMMEEMKEKKVTQKKKLQTNQILL